MDGGAIRKESVATGDHRYTTTTTIIILSSQISTITVDHTRALFGDNYYYIYPSN